MASTADFLAAPLDLARPEAPAFRAGIQGNILKGHGRDHVALIFAAFQANGKKTRAWLAGPLRRRMNSAASQSNETARWRAARDGGTPFVAFFLSQDGYRRLGVDDAAIPNDPYFRAGMKGTPPDTVQPHVTDPAVTEWEPAFRDRIDAMILVGDDVRTRLDGLVATLCDELKPLSERVWVERGDKLLFDFPGRPRVAIEHFGHQDGISQPQMIRQEADTEIGHRGGTNWDPAAPLSHAFIEEPGGSGTFGSYLVFRKLEQRVKSFRDARDGLATALDIDVEQAAALVVGRFRDGRPLIPTQVVTPGADCNDFNFKSDTKAALCPFQAHIRKTNPRGDLAKFRGQTDETERSFRISRRGITYGTRPDLVAGSALPPPDGDVGLLFMSYQARILQFVIQQDGSDFERFRAPRHRRRCRSRQQSVAGRTALADRRCPDGQGVHDGKFREVPWRRVSLRSESCLHREPRAGEVVTGFAA